MKRAFLFAAALALTSCGGGPKQTCLPGEQRSCPCVGNTFGIQVCNGDGTALGACTGCPGGSGDGPPAVDLAMTGGGEGGSGGDGTSGAGGEMILGDGATGGAFDAPLEAAAPTDGSAPDAPMVLDGAATSDGPALSDGGAMDLAAADLLPPPGTVHCGGQWCTGGAACCHIAFDGGYGPAHCATTCPNGYFTSCDSPDDCSGNPCCITIRNGSVSSASQTCTAGPSSCPPTVSPFTFSGETRLCRTSADCTSGIDGGVLFSECCTYQPSKQHFCWSHSYPLTGYATCP